LPAPGGAGLPALGGAGLPALGGAGLPAIGGAGLPALGGAALPSPAGASLPALGGASLPSPVGAGLPSLGGAALPTPASALPSPAAPKPLAPLDLDLDGPPASKPAALSKPSTPAMGLPMSAPALEPDPFAQPVRPMSLPQMDATKAPQPIAAPKPAGRTPPGPRDLDFEADAKPAKSLPTAKAPSMVFDAVQPDAPIEPDPRASFEPPSSLSAEFRAPSAAAKSAVRTPAAGVNPPRSSAPGTPPRGNNAPTLAEGFDLPLPPPPENGPIKRGGMGFGEIDLGGETPAASGGGDADEFDQIPVEGGPPGNSAASTTLDTDGPPRQQAAATGTSRPTSAPRPTVQKDEPKRKGLYVAVGGLGSVVLIGAALSFTSAGPFGINAVDQALHGAERKAAATAAIQGARRLLAQDTFGAARRALRQLDDQLARTPKEAELHAYATFANYFVLARFGTDASISGRARALFEKLPTLPSGTEYIGAAQSARELSQGHPERVRRSRSPEPAAQDLEVMAAIDRDPSSSVEVARAAATSRRSIRTRFMLARALFVGDDQPAALREAESLIAESPQHAGARLLAAKILASNPERGARAVSLAREVEALAREASTDEKVEAAVLIGDVEFALDHVNPAREAYERALAIDPRAPSALVGAGRVLYRQRAFSESLAKFTAASTADSNDIDAAIGVGMASIALGRHAEAQPRLEQLAQAHPNDAKVRFWWARALLAMDNRPAAERELREAMRLDDTMLEAYTTLASMLFSAQQPREAEAVLERARGRVADQAAIHRALGEGRFARGDMEGAENELRQVVADHAEDLRTRLLLAQVLRRRRNFDGAGRELDAISRTDAEYPGLLLERGMLLQARGDAQGAVSIFRTALAGDQQNTELLVNLSAALVAAGAYEEADRQIANVVETQPNIAEAQYVLGRARLGKGNVVDAIRLLERATELDATRADFRAYAAEANLLRAGFARAIEHANQACTLDPSFARGFWIRGEVRVRQHQAREALLDARRALELDPMFPDAMVTYAEADSQLGQAAAAMELYRRALAISPDRAEWRARYARLFADAGRDADALRELEQACRIGDNLPTPPPWLVEAHRLAGEVALRANRRDAARQHYRRFIDLAAPGSAGLDDARRALQE
jgi:tetratricopeptide (TPR) repeat protein